MAAAATRVLLLEDDRSDADLVVREIRSEAGDEFSFHHVPDLHEAAEALKAMQPDVVLLDLNIPECDGVDTYRRFRALDESLPVVVLTGALSEGVGVHAVKLGAQDYITKQQMDGASLARALRYAVIRNAYLRGLREHVQVLELRYDQIARAFRQATQAAPATGVDQRALEKDFHAILDDALANRNRASKDDVRDQIGRFAAECVAQDMHPAKMMEIMVAALRGQTAPLAPSAMAAALDEGRTRMLEALGYVAALYRKRGGGS